MPPAPEAPVSDRQRAADKKARLYAILGTVLISVGLLSYTISSSIRKAGDIGARNEQGIACVLEQLGNHRMNNYAADASSAQRHGHPFEVPAPPPPALPRELLSACKTFYEGTP